MSNKKIEGSLIKKAHSTQRWTEKDIEDLQKCHDPVTGPHYFLENFFYIQHPVKGRLKYEPFEYQRRLIDSYHNHRFNVNLLPRQTGKCVLGNILIKIRNHVTLKEYELPIEIYHKFMQAQQNNQLGPDISSFEIK